jgi:uncharacterized phage protein (TIGR01671 family)
MREIKFRQFINGKFHYWGNKNQNCFIGPVTPIIESQQFTGLKDKHGKEIYEGDIVRKDGWIYEIRWSKYGAGFDLATKNDSWPKQEDGYAYHSGLYDTEIIEVIGNVYENPELAGGTQKEEK